MTGAAWKSHSSVSIPLSEARGCDLSYPPSLCASSYSVLSRERTAVTLSHKHGVEGSLVWVTYVGSPKVLNTDPRRGGGSRGHNMEDCSLMEAITLFRDGAPCGLLLSTCKKTPGDRRCLPYPILA